MTRLLILSCSKQKKRTRGPLPAIERYDGPAFRVLRKYLRECATEAPVVLILSAKFGLIEAAEKIPYYERRLTVASAEKLRPQILRNGARVLTARSWRRIGVSAGREYRTAISGLQAFVPAKVPFEVLAGGLGPRLTALRDWLRQDDA